MQRRVKPVAATDYPNDWARFIEGLIGRPGWSQQRLADEAGVHRSTVRRWRQSEIVNISSESIRLIAEASGVSERVVMAAAVGVSDRIDEDEAIAEVQASDLPGVLKDEIIDYIRRQRDKAEADLRQAVQMMMRSHRAAS